MSGRQKAKALLHERESDEQNDGTDRLLVYHGPDEGDQAEPRQEEVEDAVDETASTTRDMSGRVDNRGKANGAPRGGRKRGGV